MTSQQSYESILDVALGSAMAILQQRSTEQLSELIGDDEQLDQIIKDLPQAKTMRTEREMLLAQNKSLAEWNLSQEPKLKEAKTRLQETYEEAKALHDQAVQKKSDLEQLSDTKSLDTTQILLETAAREAEEESEAIAEQLLQGEIPADEFVKTFKDKRGLAHMRKIKSDQMKELLRNQQFADSSNSNAFGGQRPRPPNPPAQQAYPWNYTM